MDRIYILIAVLLSTCFAIGQTNETRSDLEEVLDISHAIALNPVNSLEHFSTVETANGFTVIYSSNEEVKPSTFSALVVEINSAYQVISITGNSSIISKIKETYSQPLRYYYPSIKFGYK